MDRIRRDIKWDYGEEDAEFGSGAPTVEGLTATMTNKTDKLGSY